MLSDSYVILIPLLADVSLSVRSTFVCSIAARLHGFRWAFLPRVLISRTLSRLLTINTGTELSREPQRTGRVRQLLRALLAPRNLSIDLVMLAEEIVRCAKLLHGHAQLCQLGTFQILIACCERQNEVLDEVL